MMRIISHSVLWLIVIGLLNGCLFSTDSEQRWELALEAQPPLRLAATPDLHCFIPSSSTFSFGISSKTKSCLAWVFKIPTRTSFPLSALAIMAVLPSPRPKLTLRFGIWLGHNQPVFGLSLTGLSKILPWVTAETKY